MMRVTFATSCFWGTGAGVIDVGVGVDAFVAVTGDDVGGLVLVGHTMLTLMEDLIN